MKVARKIYAFLLPICAISFFSCASSGKKETAPVQESVSSSSKSLGSSGGILSGETGKSSGAIKDAQ